MHKNFTTPTQRGKTNSNVTIIKFKTPEKLKRKQALVLNVEEQDPLAITDYDWEKAESSNIQTKFNRIKSVGARKEIPEIKKAKNSSSKTTLLTPTGLKKIQTIPIDSVTNIKEKSKITKTLSSVKRSARFTKTSFNFDSSEDSDEFSSKTVKKSNRTQKSLKTSENENKKVVKHKKSVDIKKNKKLKKSKPSLNKCKNNSKNITKIQSNIKNLKPKKNYKMIQKRNQRTDSSVQADYKYLTKKRGQHNNKKLIAAKKKANLKTNKTQKKVLDDYLPLIRKYRHLIPDHQPIVRIERLKFRASYFTHERMRLVSDTDLFRDGATFYGLLGKIFNNLQVKDKLRCSRVCRLWNRAINEDAAWFNLHLKNVFIHDLRALERLILKRETKILLLKNVDVDSKAADYELCRLSCVKKLIVEEASSSILVDKLILACNELENIVITDKNLHSLTNINIYIKSLNAENSIISESENRLLKTWSDLESLVVHSFDPTFYYNMGLLLSLKFLKLNQLIITSNISQFIENIPNIEYIEFAPEYSNITYAEGNKAIVESLKHCPSLKKLTWVTFTQIKIKKETNQGNFDKSIKNEISTEKNKNLLSSLDAPETSALNENGTEKMDIDVNISEEKVQQPNMECQMEEDKMGDKESIESKTSECVSYDQDNIELKNEIGKLEIIREELDDYNKKIVYNEKDLKEDKNFDFYIEPLQLLAFKTYLKTSLSECEINFKVMKKYDYENF